MPGRRSDAAGLPLDSKFVSCWQDNLLHGRFLAELTKEVMVDLEASKYQHAEYRISIYGRKRVEWDILAAWVVQNKLASDNVIWLIQVPPPAGTLTPARTPAPDEAHSNSLNGSVQLGWALMGSAPMCTLDKAGQLV